MKISGHLLTEKWKYNVLKTLRELKPKKLPTNWSYLGTPIEVQLMYISTNNLRALLEVELIDEELWLHVSFSRKDRIPDWTDVTEIKSVFIGDDRKAIQVLPPKAEHVNIHERCLHLYSPLTRDPLPDFRGFDQTGILAI